METFRRNISEKKANFYFIGDIHEGSCNFRDDLFRKAVKIIADDPVGYWFGMGDYIEAITTHDTKRFDPASVHPSYRVKDLKNLPLLQIERFFDNVFSIRNKCLGLIIGNHEASYAKFNSADVYRHLLHLMADRDQQRIKELTLGYIAVGVIQVVPSQKKSKSFSITLNHGDGGNGYLAGYPINKMSEMFRYFNTDVGIMGHIHQLEAVNTKVITARPSHTDKSGATLVKDRRNLGVSGTFLETYVDGNANYFEGKGRKEGDIGFLKLEVHANVMGRETAIKRELKKIVLD